MKSVDNNILILLFGLLITVFLTSTPVYSQIINGSFETEAGDFSMVGWETALGIPNRDTVPGGGEWSLEITGGCVWNSCSQPVLSVRDQEIWELRCWAKRINHYGAGNIQWSTNFHKIASVHDTIWTQISIVDTFQLKPDDTVSVILEAGGGIVASGGALFDLVEVEKIGIITSVKNNLSEDMLEDITLFTNHPNPFNTSTTMCFDLHKETHLECHITNCAGQKITTLLNKQLRPGRYSVHWDGKTESGLAVESGLYIIYILTGDLVKIRKVMLIK